MKKIIIIEDDLDLLESLGVLFESEGFKVWKFSKAEPAIKKMEKLNPDALVIDLMLPGINGDEATSFIKSRPDYKNKRIVLISADEGVAKSAKVSGADAYLKKPFTFENLLGLV